MPVKLRLRRLGRTHQAFYQIVAADSRSPRDGKFIEKIGTYNPVTVPHQVTVDHSKAMKWLKNGAQPTETVRSIFSHEGIMLKLHLHRKGKNEAEITTAFDKWSAEKTRKKEQLANAAARTKDEQKKARMEAERKRREAVSARIAAKNTPAPAAAAEEAPAAEGEAAAE